MSAPQPYGMMATFPTPESLSSAVQSLREFGYTRLDAFSPYPIEGLPEKLGARRTRLPYVVLAGGLLGAAAAYLLILYSVEIDYPINVGGRPMNAWPAYLVLAFEAGVLGAAIAGFVGMLAANGLPRYHHPVFGVSDFSYGSGGRFHLLLKASDPLFRPVAARNLLKRLGAHHIELVKP
ncbi:MULTISPECIES: DUF3341 domain-containing protein [unclassified Mesorhizobium]|uniref:DUF3341 domain-containing protein n=1 Tax=unclassified Mesorhizobium TaxID=325217 RepID=UPI00112C8B28|nr:MULTISPECIES: DUF3341 domain-containing protein [unclassified Mesorhizobium]MBZ9974248.1 DUF3341 domain-containing protein [Mesorhizobium sp. BR-1-1-10]TPK10259.1 DUF3341 domain-containing protein [Mesorhizobium sp. B2-5-7]